MANQTQNLIPNDVPTGNPACEGRKSITTIIDFSIGLVFTLDLSFIVDQLARINSVQTLFVDNSLNSNSITITTGVVNQKIVIPPLSQAYIPVLQNNPPVLRFQSSVAVTLPIQILNFFLPPIVWSVNGTPVLNPSGYMYVTDPILDATVSNNKVNVNQVPYTIQTLTDASGTITAGGTGQIAIPASASRVRWIIENPSAATEILQLSFGAAGAGKIDLLPGAAWDESNSSIVGDAVYVVAATTGHSFTAYYK